MQAPATEHRQVVSPSPSGSSPPSGDTTPDVIISWKRRISELEQEIDQIRDIHKHSKA